MGLYLDTPLFSWFTAEFNQRINQKLDMGESCIRFKKMDSIPFDLIGELASKMTVEQWINLYENVLMTSKKSK